MHIARQRTLMTNFRHVHEVINAWEGSIGGDLGRVEELGHSLDAADLIDAAQDIIVSASAFGLEHIEAVVTRVHTIGAHLQDARLAEDPTWSGAGFSPVQNAILDLAESLGRCGSCGGEKLQIWVTTNAGGVALAGAVVSALAVASFVAGLGVETPVERVAIIRGYYDVKEWSQDNNLI